MTTILRGPPTSPGCAECPCAVNGQPVKAIRGAGVTGSLAIVGEGPASDEMVQGWPFVGASGKLLQEVFNNAGINRHSIWITNALLCQRPWDAKKLLAAVACCRPRLEHELSLVQPKTVLALGATAAQALALPVGTISDARGTTQRSPLTDAPVITAIHPAAILRGGAGEIKGGGKQKMNVDAQMVFLQADVAKAYKLAVDGPVGEWKDNIDLFVDNSHDTERRALTFLEMASQAKMIAIDLEWNAEKQITWLGIAFGDMAGSFYWPIMREVNAQILLRAAAYVGASTFVPKVFHNMQADIGIWESQIGPIGGVCEDTMLLHHAAYPGAAHDLQQVTSQFLLVPPWKANRAAEEKGAKKAIAANERAVKKSLKQMEHEARNAASAAEAKERKTRRKKAHDERNTTAHFLKLLGDK